MRNSEFFWAPQEAPFFDGSGGMDMSQSETGELVRRKYDFLGNLEPKGEIFGHSTVGEFVDDIVQTVEEKGSADLGIMGEPLSGKSFAASQFGALFAELNITPYYIPWVEVIRDARETGVIPSDSPFGVMGAENYGLVNEFFYEISRAVAEATEGEPSVRIEEAPGIPTIEAYNDEGLVIADRGATTFKRLVSQHGGHIAGLYGSAGVREMGRDFRQGLEDLDPENLNQTLDEFGLSAAATIDPEQAAKIFKESGAPFKTLDHYAEVVNNTVLFLAHPEINYIELPKKARAHPRKYLEEHPQERTKIIGKQLLPYLIAERFGAREDQALLALNRKTRKNKKITRFDMEPALYSNVIDIHEVARRVREPRVHKLQELFY